MSTRDVADLYTRTASSRAPRPQVWLNVAVAIGLLVVALSSLAGAAFVGSGVAPASLSGKREFLLVPAPTVAALIIWWMGALLTLSGDPVIDDDGGHEDPAVSDGEGRSNSQQP